MLSGGRPETGVARRIGKRAAGITMTRLERAGVHLLPRHFYSPVADRAWLRGHEQLWRRAASMAGVEWDLDAQVRWLEGVCTEHLPEVANFPFVLEAAAVGIPFRYGLIEGQVLHCLLRKSRPRRIVEVGSGASTAIMATAIARNRLDGGPATMQRVIDPYATEAVFRLEGVEVLRYGALEAPAEMFEELAAGDLLFIDSSHALKTGSELGRLYLEVLPSLAAGVIVHIHDVYLPYTYSPWVLEDLWDWQETTLLLALLSGNSSLGVLCAESALHHDRAADLGRILPDYRPLPTPGGLAQAGSNGHFPSSTYLIKR